MAGEKYSKTVFIRSDAGLEDRIKRFCRHIIKNSNTPPEGNYLPSRDNYKPFNRLSKMVGSFSGPNANKYKSFVNDCYKDCKTRTVLYEGSLEEKDFT